MAYSLLRDVNDNTQDWHVRVRIARFWEHTNAAKNHELVRLQFVMVDEKGCAMQCSISKAHIDKFKGKLLEGHAYYLHYLDVKPARDSFRAADHAFEAWLTKWTGVLEISPIPESLPRYAYKLRSFQNILANVNDKTYLADVIGIVTGVSNAVVVDVKGRPTSKRILRLTDTRDTATIALWGTNAEAIDAENLIDASSREPVIALIMGCTHRKQDSMLELSASYGSQVCINTELPEIVSLRDRLVGSVYPVVLIAEKGKRFESSEIQVATVPELADVNPHVNMGKRYRCKILIDGLQPNQGWWYLACDSCSCKAVEEGTSYRCSSEKCGGRSASPRFKLSVVAAGDGSSVEMVFFGDLARDLIGKPADVLVAENCGLLATLPAEINVLIGRTYVVDVAVSRYSFRMNDISYQVLKFYPEGSSVFVGLGASSMDGTKVPEASVGGLASQETGSGSGGNAGLAEPADRSVAAGLTTPPPPVIPDTPAHKTSVSTTEGDDSDVPDTQSPVGDNSGKKETGVKRTLFPDVSDKTAKKARKHK